MKRVLKAIVIGAILGGIMRTLLFVITGTSQEDGFVFDLILGIFGGGFLGFQVGLFTAIPGMIGGIVAGGFIGMFGGIAAASVIVRVWPAAWPFFNPILCGASIGGAIIGGVMRKSLGRISTGQIAVFIAGLGISGALGGILAGISGFLAAVIAVVITAAAGAFIIVIIRAILDGRFAKVEVLQDFIKKHEQRLTLGATRGFLIGGLIAGTVVLIVAILFAIILGEGDVFAALVLLPLSGAFLGGILGLISGFLSGAIVSMKAGGEDMRALDGAIIGSVISFLLGAIIAVLGDVFRFSFIAGCFVGFIFSVGIVALIGSRNRTAGFIIGGIGASMIGIIAGFIFGNFHFTGGAIVSIIGALGSVYAAVSKEFAAEKAKLKQQSRSVKQ